MSSQRHFTQYSL